MVPRVINHLYVSLKISLHFENEVSMGSFMFSASIKKCHLLIYCVFNFYDMNSYCVGRQGNCTRQNQNPQGSWGDSRGVPCQNWSCHARRFQAEGLGAIVWVDLFSSNHFGAHYFITCSKFLDSHW